MTDLNEAQKRGKLASIKGFANESRLLAALLARGFNASKVDLPHSTYDLIVEKDRHETIRVQVKTVGTTGSISFKGGARGGQDRHYKSSVKDYTYSKETADVVVGVEAKADNGDKEVNFYFVPTLHIEKLGQGSLSIKKIQQTKNNWQLLRECKNPEYIRKIFGTKTK